MYSYSNRKRGTTLFQNLCMCVAQTRVPDVSSVFFFYKKIRQCLRQRQWKCIKIRFILVKSKVLSCTWPFDQKYKPENRRFFCVFKKYINQIIHYPAWPFDQAYQSCMIMLFEHYLRLGNFFRFGTGVGPDFASASEYRVMSVTLLLNLRLLSTNCGWTAIVSKHHDCCDVVPNLFLM